MNPGFKSYPIVAPLRRGFEQTLFTMPSAFGVSKVIRDIVAEKQPRFIGGKIEVDVDEHKFASTALSEDSGYRKEDWNLLIDERVDRFGEFDIKGHSDLFRF